MGNSSGQLRRFCDAVGRLVDVLTVTTRGPFDTGLCSRSVGSLQSWYSGKSTLRAKTWVTASSRKRAWLASAWLLLGTEDSSCCCAPPCESNDRIWDEDAIQDI